MADQSAPAAAEPAISIVVPVKDEADNVGPLVEEIAAAVDGRWRFEAVFVDDGSRDNTESEVDRLRSQRPWLRLVKHARSCGQSAAIRTGVCAARAPIIVTLDGDGQNDPSFIPALVRSLEQAPPRVALIAGQRVGRKSSRSKQFQSRVANGVRATILRDGTRDT